MTVRMTYNSDDLQGLFADYGGVDLGQRVSSLRLGSLLTPGDLQVRLQITPREYDELLILGLPLVRFGNGDVRHPTSAVDEFFRHMGDPNRQKLPELVGTRYVADRLDCTTEWVTQMIASRAIPPSCIAPGTGNGKPWKFIRVRIDEWIRRR